MLHPSVTAPVAISLALPMLSALHGRPPLAAIGASSHWLWPEAGADGRFHPGETGVGIATNLVAAAMWGAVMAATLRRTAAPPLTVAVAVAVGAAVIDYGVLPRRLSPGWDRVLSPVGVVAGFVALAVGMAAGVPKPLA